MENMRTSICRGEYMIWGLNGMRYGSDEIDTYAQVIVRGEFEFCDFRCAVSPTRRSFDLAVIAATIEALG